GAVPDGGPADGGALRVGRAAGIRARAALGEVARTGGGPALHAARLDGVGGAAGGRPRAALGDVPVPRDGPALHTTRLEGVLRAGRARARARFRDVAVARGGAALDGRGHQRVRRAVVADPIAALGHVALPGRWPADARALHVGRARHVRARAELRQVAVAGRGAADDVRPVPVRRMDARPGGVAHVAGARILVVRARGVCRLRAADARSVLARVEAAAGVQVVAGSAVVERR